MNLSEKQIEILTFALHTYAEMIPNLLDNEFIQEDRKNAMREYMEMMPELKKIMSETRSKMMMDRLVQEYLRVGV
jgi:hypothetical protein